MQSTQNENISTDPETAMVSALPHDERMSTGILVAIILLSILILLVCSTLAICYIRRKDCFHQKTRIQTINELSRKSGRDGCNDTCSGIEEESVL